MYNQQSPHFFISMSAYFFDLDGCVYHGDQLDDGAKRLIELLQAKKKKVIFITNNSNHSSLEISNKLIRLGLPVESKAIITATEYVHRFVLEKYGLVSVGIAGSDTLQDSFRQAGFRIVPLASEENPDIIVIGRDMGFTYEKLQQIVEAERLGAKIISVNPDMYHPGAGGLRVPETGALVAAVESMIRSKVECFGKPEPYLFHYGMGLCDAKAENCVMVGDNLFTDIRGGSRAGMRTVWIRLDQDLKILDGIERGDHQPDCIVNRMEQLALLYEGGRFSSDTNSSESDASSTEV